MHWRFKLWIILSAISVVSASAAFGAVTITVIEYHGWANSYQMSNGVVDLVYVPQIGRVMRYGYVGGPNVLWNNTSLYGKLTNPANPGKEWINYGGDKLWPAPQSVWGWPPDPSLDSGEQIVTLTPSHHLKVEGHTSAQYHIRFLREISMDSTGAGVTFKNIMLNANPGNATGPGPTDVTWSIWEVTQVDSPDEARLPIYKGGHFKDGYFTFKDAAPQLGASDAGPDFLRVRRDAGKPSKVGGDSPLGYLEADVHGTSFRVSAAVEKGRTYPDDGCAEEIYTNPDPLPYMELELLGPTHTLQAGKTAELVTRWNLTKH